MLVAKTTMFRDNGDMFFAWTIEDEDGLLAHIDDFPTMRHCEESMYRHLSMWSKGDVCSVNGLLMTVN